MKEIDARGLACPAPVLHSIVLTVLTKLKLLLMSFPTTDCSMCILSPYLVAAGRHSNIKLITYAQVESVTGEPGHFT